METKQQHTESTGHRDYILEADGAGGLRGRCQECGEAVDIGGPRP